MGSLSDASRTRHEGSQSRVQSYNSFYIGVVKDNSDVQRMGRLSVWIPQLGPDPGPGKYIIAAYISPFAGSTDERDLGNNVNQFEQTQTSYGFWFVPPDINAKVAVLFENGNLRRAYWFGCAFHDQMNAGVPSVACSPDNPKGIDLPVAEYNKNTKAVIKYNSMTRPVNTVAADGVKNQGLVKDYIRGLSTSSARRDTVSEVYGISTPGPNLAGTKSKRTGGSQFVMDDKLGNEHITLKTKSGAQIRIDETNELVYIINKPGTAWVQLDKDGNVDIFSAKSLSIRAQEDINLRADKNVNIEAGNNVNIKAAKTWSGTPGAPVAAEKGGQGGTINLQANDATNLISETDIKIQSKTSINLAANQDVFVKAGANYHLKAGANVHATAGAATHLKSSAAIVIQGSMIDMNGGAAAPAADAQTPTPVPTNTKKNMLPDFTDAEKMSRKEQPGVTTIASRFVTFEPCPEHVNKGLTKPK